MARSSVDSGLVKPRWRRRPLSAAGKSARIVSSARAICSRDASGCSISCLRAHSAALLDVGLQPLDDLLDGASRAPRLLAEPAHVAGLLTDLEAERLQRMGELNAAPEARLVRDRASHCD